MASSMGGAFLAHGGPGGGISGTIRESLVLIREAGRGNYTRMGGSATLLLQYLGGLNLLYKNTATSAIQAAIAEEQLADKLNLTALVARKEYETESALLEASNLATAGQMAEVETLRLKAVAAEQAAIAQGKNAEATALAARVAQSSATTTITPLGWIAAALLVVGVAAFAVIRHFVKLYEAVENFRNLANPLKGSFEAQAQATQEAADAMQKEIDRLKELTDAENLNRDAIQDTLKAMQEKAAFEQKMAEARGYNKVYLAHLETAALKEQLDYITQAADAQKAKVEADKQAESNAVSRQASGGHARELAAAKEAQAAYGEILDKFRDINKPSTDRKVLATALTLSGHPVEGLESLPGVTGATERATTTVGNKEYRASFDEAKKAYNENAQKVKDLSAAQQTLIDATTEKKKQTDKDLQQLQEYNRLQQELSDKLQNQSKYGIPTAALEDAKRRKPSDDTLVRTGNFLGLSRNAIENISANQLLELKKINSVLLRIEQARGMAADLAGFSY